MRYDKIHFQYYYHPSKMTKIRPSGISTISQRYEQATTSAIAAGETSDQGERFRVLYMS